METKPLIEVKNILLGYAPTLPPVLAVEHLTIPSGKLVFVNGPSGIGKSTLLEFLGLMTNTMVSQEGSYVLRPEGSKEVELSSIWSRPDGEISSVRSHHFSFVFQSTNLMPNFSVGENMCFNLLTSGLEPKQAKETVLQLMDDLDLPRTLYDRSVVEASGGQRQRIAFVRAFCTPFSVLFGDEPTGNLDVDNAKRLLEKLKAKLVKLNRTAVIVSHDQNLSKEFGDFILNIVPGQSGEPNRIVQDENI